MAPQIERQRFDDILRCNAYFAVHLNNDERLDIAEFDAIALHDGRKTKSPYGGTLVQLKYVVIDDVMHFFPEWIEHKMHYKNLSQCGYDGTLQAAGDVRIHCPDDRSIVTKRVIGGESVSLEYTLPYEISDAYKRDVLQPKLGEFFEVQ